MTGETFVAFPTVREIVERVIQESDTAIDKLTEQSDNGQLTRAPLLERRFGNQQMPRLAFSAFRSTGSDTSARDLNNSRMRCCSRSGPRGKRISLEENSNFRRPGCQSTGR